LIGPIQRRSAFTKLSKEGTYVRSGSFWCIMLLDPSLTMAHVGYAIGRPYGGAVERNRLRRRLRVLMASHCDALLPGSYLVGATPGANQQDFVQLGASVSRLISAILARTSDLVAK